MNERPRTYRLPDGEITRDVHAYLAAWDALAAKALSFFPGYVEHSRDPDLNFVKYGVNGLGVTVIVDRFTLSPDAIKVLTAPPPVPKNQSRDYEDDDFCDHCQKETKHLCHSDGHERDSSGDWRKCLVCGWRYSFYTGKYEEP